jgi:myo-inositol-1(or 4)-monophosphatase
MQSSIPELSTARQSARAAARVIMRHFRAGVLARGKTAETPFDLVSDADLEAEKAIVDTIQRLHPRHHVLAEEAHKAEAQAEHLWIVDPIDGTNNFAHGIAQFAVSIAYYREGRPQCGVICNPATDEWFEAVAGKGAFKGGKPVRVAAHERLDQSLIGVGFYYDRGAMMEATLATIGDLFRAKIHGIRRFGAASLDLANVGIGAFGGFFEYELYPWDFAAGRLFVEEAGGKVTTCTGQPLPIERSSVLATNGALHAAIQEIVSRRATPHAG